MATIRENIQSVIAGISDMFARLGNILQAINDLPSYTSDMTQIKALLTEIRDKPTELTGDATVTFDTTPIVQAITDLRGTGPENTIKSVNQSIWDLAGTAPGKSLLDLYDLLEAALMTQAQAPDPSMPYLLQLRSIIGIYGDGDPQYGNIRYLVDEMHQALNDGLFTQTNPRVPYLLDVRTRLNDIDYTIGERNNEDISLYQLIEDMEAGIQQQLVLDSTSGIPPTSECSSPYKSNALFLVPVANLIYAQFPDPPPDGVTFGTIFGLTEDRGELHSDDWAGAKVYVQSNASQFAMDASPTRYSTNQWIDLEGSGSRSFSVDSQYSLDVWLCAPLVSADFLTVNSEISSYGNQVATVLGVDIPAGTILTITPSQAEGFLGVRIYVNGSIVVDELSKNSAYGQHIFTNSYTNAELAGSENERGTIPFVLTLSAP